MSVTLLLTALAMGLAATPHCAAMCGAACAGLTGTGQGREAGAGTVFVLRQVATDRRTIAFHVGRLTGYSAVGALAALATQGLALLTAQGGALRPLWTLFHLLVLAWGLSLLVLAHQPDWAQRASLQLWARIRPAVQGQGSLFAAGLLWVFMPCGLLWSALLVASLTASPWEGALAMGLFATASSIGLVLMPVLMARLRSAQGPGKDWGTRLAGAVLVFAALAALGMDMGRQILAYCV
ncbi:MAG: sulfite exporter TauE/SafE family protein [Ramlibacter sp.]|nr:sulfite exporter TauE/SafE family protein [Ramlibacter sp.]MDH4378259.1 sulfite exporter TauE/SafE family protein [Ramlibacter sp.]